MDENGSYIAGSKQYGYCEEDCPETLDIFVRTVDDDNGSYESDTACGREESCKYQTSCQDFLKQKEHLYGLKRDSQEYRRALTKIRNSICNNLKQKVCCPEKCKGGHPCLKENQCEYAQALRIKFKNGDNNARQELIGLICDRREKTFCCPPTTTTGSGNPSEKTTNDQISSDEKGPSWLPGKGKCGSSGEHASTANNVIGGVATAPGMFPFTALLGYPNSKRQWSEQLQKYYDDNSPKYKCGGTLINHWYVVTAAHCQGSSERSKISSVTPGDWEVDRIQDCLNNDKNNCLEPSRILT